MPDKRMTADEVVAELRSGMTIGIGGWGSRRKPMSLVRAILRSPLSDLVLVTFGGPDAGLLCAAGKVKRLIYGFVSLDSIPLEPHFQAARQAGTIEVTEYDEGMLRWGLYAASLRLPFLPTRAGLGTDVMRLNPELRNVRSPYADGAELVAVPALPLDAALIHLNRADAAGNAQFLGPDLYFDDLFAAAASRTYVSCERIVPAGELAAAGFASLRIPRWMTAGVVESHNGAHFTSCDPDYPRDEAFQRTYVAAAKDPAAWKDFEARYLQGTEEDYQRAIKQASQRGASERSEPKGRIEAPRGRATLAEICALACAEAWRGDGEVLASPFGIIPTIGARLARATFAPDLMLTDGEAMLVAGTWAVGDPAPGPVEGWMPYRDVLELVWTGRRHAIMAPSQIDQFGHSNISAIGDFARPSRALLGMRGTPGNTACHPVSYWVPRHLPRVFVPRVDVVCGVGYDTGGQLPDLRRVVTNLGVLDFGGPGHAMRLVSVHPGVEVAEVVANTGFDLVIDGEIPQTRMPTEEELRLIRDVIDPHGARYQEVP
jgi:glutaconate CoA-transferase subunit A